MDLVNKGLQTTGGKCYLITETTFERLEFQFVPSSLKQSRNAEINPVQIIGRNIPRYQNTGGVTKLTFTLDFIADETSRSSVLMKIRWLENLAYNNASQDPAQRVQLIFGDIYKKHLWTVESVDADLSAFSKPHNYLPTQATAEIVLAMDWDFNPMWTDLNPEFTQGAPDGQDPVNLGVAAESQDTTERDAAGLSNNNTFAEMLRRLSERLRF